MRIPAPFLKDATISSDAKALRAVLGAFADGHTGRTYVKPCTLEELLGWGEARRLAAQRQLVRSGWLRLGWKRGTHGRWARRIFVLVQPTAPRFDRYGRNEALIIYHKHAEPVSGGESLSGVVRVRSG